MPPKSAAFFSIFSDVEVICFELKILDFFVFLNRPEKRSLQEAARCGIGGRAGATLHPQPPGIYTRCAVKKMVRQQPPVEELESKHGQGGHPVKVRPESLAGYESETCRLCGARTKLTRTHVPPRAAGNSGRARRGVEHERGDGAVLTGLSRPKDGGASGLWLCRRCNGATGRWDKEYVQWVRGLVLQLHDGGAATGSRFTASIRAGDPGAVVRSMWAWMFALDAELLTRQPALAKAVLTGAPVEPPHDVRLLLAATRSLRIWACGQAGGYAVDSAVDGAGGHLMPSGAWVPGSRVLSVPRAVVASPPFVALLAGVNDDVRVPYFDTAGWLAERAPERREVSLYLPFVRPLEADGPVTLVTYEQLVC